jgi:hypothetical protein
MDIGIYGMAVLAYFSYGILVFSLKNCGITILEILRYTVFAILDSKTAVIDKICLQYYGIEYVPPMPPSRTIGKTKTSTFCMSLLCEVVLLQCLSQITSKQRFRVFFVVFYRGMVL